MSETQKISEELSADMERAMREDILPLTHIMEEAFAQSARRIEEEMAQAAKSGAVSFKSMVDDILNDLARLAADEFIRQPIENAILGALGGRQNDPSRYSSASQSQLASSLIDILAKGQRNR